MASSNVRTGKADARGAPGRADHRNSTPLDRSIRPSRADKPSVLLVVGVNGTGKTTTVGNWPSAGGRRPPGRPRRPPTPSARRRRRPVAELGVAGRADGAGRRGADPASVARATPWTKGIATAGADVVVIDTAEPGCTPDQA